MFAVKACDSNMLALNCSSYDFTINILHAWYHLGSFPHSCGQQHTTTVSSCPAFDAKNKVVSKCQDYRECRIPVSESLSGESCPSAARQLEVFYQCTSRNLKSKFNFSLLSKHFDQLVHFLLFDCVEIGTRAKQMKEG